MLLLSVLLTRRVKAISLPPHKCSNWLTVPFQSGKKQNKKNKTNPEVTAAFLTATPAAFVAWVSLWCTDCCSASTLQRCRNHEHLGTCGRTKRTLNWKCITVKKKKKKYFILCCFISTFSEGMSSWGFNHRPRSSTGQHVFYCWPLGNTIGFLTYVVLWKRIGPELQVTQRRWKMHRTAEEFKTGSQQEQKALNWKH